jgi:transcriptional regulator with PAS, ATPase and Fis domain
MNDKTELLKRFPDLVGAQAAMLRAAENARKLAEQTGTKLVVGQPKPASKING